MKRLKILFLAFVMVFISQSTIYAVNDWIINQDGVMQSASVGMLQYEIVAYYLQQYGVSEYADFVPDKVYFRARPSLIHDNKLAVDIKLLNVGDNWDNLEWCEYQTNALYQFLKKTGWIVEIEGATIGYYNNEGVELWGGCMVGYEGKEAYKGAIKDDWGFCSKDTRPAEEIKQDLTDPEKLKTYTIWDKWNSKIDYN